MEEKEKEREDKKKSLNVRKNRSTPLERLPKRGTIDGPDPRNDIDGCRVA